MIAASSDGWESANFAVNVAIAVGTISAAVVAAALGRSSQLAERRRREHQQVSAARQVLALYDWHLRADDSTGPGVRMINGGSEVIRDVTLRVIHEGKPFADADNYVWGWRFPEIFSERKKELTVPVMMARESLKLAGGWVEAAGPGTLSLRGESADKWRPVVTVTWRDSLGQRWQRVGHDQPQAID